MSRDVFAVSAVLLFTVACATARSASPDGGENVDAGEVSDGGVDAADTGGESDRGTCEVCENNADCLIDHVCVPFGASRACLPRCSPVVPDCPDDFLCGGAETTFCAPTDAICCVDADDDDYGQGYQCTGPDCDDSDDRINPEAPDLCNANDDDCNPETVDGSGDLGVGVDCDGEDADMCPEGTSFCGPTGWIECDDATDDNLDVCNGIDDDCNPTTLDGNDDAQVGTACDSTGDADNCLDDIYMCNSAVPAVQCLDLSGSSTEICNGVDDDCQNGVDEMDPNLSCPDQLPDSNNVSEWGCTGTCVILSCASTTANLDGAVDNGCECTGMDYNAESCGSATTLSVGVGGTVSRSGKIGTSTGSDWFRFSFTNKAWPQNYHPSVTLSGSGGGQFTMQVRTACTTVATCGSGSGTGITKWEGNWSYTAGNACCQDTLFPRVTQVWVRVYRKLGDSPTCASYTVVAANP